MIQKQALGLSILERIVAWIARTSSSSVLRKGSSCSRMRLLSVFRSHDILLLAAWQSSVRFSCTTDQVHPIVLGESSVEIAFLFFDNSPIVVSGGIPWIE